jgi:DNA-binding GntR family transcriptional regulator
MDHKMAETATSRVEAEMRAEIARGSLQAGMRLKISELADRYGISHLPVREALRGLAAEGLIVMESHRGAIVRNVDAVFVTNIYDARGALETYLVEKCCVTATEADLARIEERMEVFEDAIARSRDIHAIVAANAAFHSEINEVAGNPIASRMIAQGWELVSSLRARYGYSPARQSQIVQDHRAIFNAIRMKNRDLARATSFAHCEQAKLDLLLMLQQS